MNAPGDPWHFARAELARKYLKVFELGLMAAGSATWVLHAS